MNDRDNVYLAAAIRRVGSPYGLILRGGRWYLTIHGKPSIAYESQADARRAYLNATERLGAAVEDQQGVGP